MTAPEASSTTANFDFFTAGELPAPQVSPERAEEIASQMLEQRPIARSLGSQQDANFLLTQESGDPLGVLKIPNEAFSVTELDAQTAAAARLASELPALRFPTLVPAQAPPTLPPGCRHSRIISYLAGGTLNGSGYLRPAVVERLGSLAGQVNQVLAEFDHPGSDRVLQWDLRHADRVLMLLRTSVADPDRRSIVDWALAEVWPLVRSFEGQLRTQVIHGDLTDDNVVCDPDGSAHLPDGVIDFGDLCRSWTVAELAVTVSSLLHHEGMTPLGVLPAIRAFDAQRPLTDAEIAALWPLVVLRGAVLVVSGTHQVHLDPDNAYAADGVEREWRILEVAARIPFEAMQTAIRRSLGRTVEALGLPAGHGRLVAEPIAAVVDLSSTSDALHRGRWLETGIEESLAREALASGLPAVRTAYGEARLTRSTPLSMDTPATVATGIEVWFHAATELQAPWAGALDRAGGTMSLRSHEWILTVSGPDLGGDVSDRPVEPGDTIAVVGAGSRVRVRLRTTGASAGLWAVPDFLTPEEFPGWSAVLADPTPLLAELGDQPGVGEAAPEDSGRLVERRAATLASVQEHYFDRPPQIERGWREHLVSTTGRSYLDMVNNVAVLGHGDPGLAEAVSAQLLRLNTNSRFVYRSLVEFSEQLTATLPEPLDTVFMVNSGSEANDLALRLAMAAAGRTDVVAVGEAYHGWTYASDAVSTSVADNPNALTSRPSWVHTVEAPNSYRGRYRGADAVQYGHDAVRRIDDLAQSGRPPAAFICEAYYGNAGGMALPDGYLEQVYATVRRHGGLTIADEVQVGYGRLGQWFWGFEQQQVVPDIVTIAKAMGNGHPLGAVITTRVIADAYRTQGYFFSSAGGSPVSSVVGSFVLAAIQERGLQANAADVGGYLKDRLLALAGRHPLIGAVHGSGLYLGVELVRDRDTREPAAAETTRICERIRELGVILQPTSDRMCVLKVKPPLLLDRAGADFFVDALDHVLTTGY